MTLDFLRDQVFWTGAADVIALVALGVAIWAQRWAARAAKMNIPAPIAIRRFDGTVTVALRAEDTTLYAIAALRVRGAKISRSKLSTTRHPQYGVLYQVSDGVEVRVLKFDPSVSEASVAGVAAGAVLKACVASRASTNARSWIPLTIR